MSILDEKIISANAELFTSIGFLVGTLLRNWLAIGHEKRKEFNQIADPLMAAPLKVPGMNSVHAQPSASTPTTLR